MVWPLDIATTRSEYAGRLDDPRITSLARSDRERALWRLAVFVNIASTVAWVPMPAAAAYSSAKAAVVAFSESLRGELEGTGVDVMVFGPHTSTEAGNAWPLEGPRVHTPEWVADELVRTLRREPKRFLAGASNRLLLWMQRVHPDLAFNMMKGIGLRAARKAGAIS